MAGYMIGGVEEPWASGTNPRSDAKSGILDAADAFANAQGFGPNWKGPSVSVSPPAERAAAPGTAAGPYRGPLGAIGGPIVDAARAVGGAVANAGIPGNPISGMFASAPPGPAFSGDPGPNRGRGDGMIASAPSAAPTVGRYPSEGSNAVRGYEGTPAAATPTGIASGATMPAPMIGNGPISNGSTVDPMVAIRNELAQRRAAEDMGQQQKIQAMQANANWAADWTAQRDAESNARVANWKAEMARTDVAGNIGGPGRDEAARLAAAAAGGANSQLSAANANLQKSQAGLAGAPRNYIDEFGKLQTADKERMTGESLKTAAGARVIEANARGTEAASKSELDRAQAAGIKLSNEQHKTILELGVKLGAATNPEARRLIERQMLVTAGKDPNKFQIIKADGRKGTNAAGMPEQEPDRIFVADDQGNIKEITGGSGGAASGPPASADRIAELKKNDTPQMRAYFDQAYGAGAAARALGK